MATPNFELLVLRLRRRLSDTYQTDGTAITLGSQDGDIWSALEMQQFILDGIHQLVGDEISLASVQEVQRFIKNVVQTQSLGAMPANGIIELSSSTLKIYGGDLLNGGVYSPLRYVPPNEWYDNIDGTTLTRTPSATAPIFTEIWSGVGSVQALLFSPVSVSYSVRVVALVQPTEPVYNTTDVLGFTPYAQERILVIAEKLAKKRLWRDGVVELQEGAMNDQLDKGRQDVNPRLTWQHNR